MTKILTWSIVTVATVGLLILVAGVTGYGVSWAAPASGRKLSFEHIVIDANGPEDIWLKSVGDLNGDGRPDLIAGGQSSGGLVWYENPTWQKHVIAPKGVFCTDGEAVDIDGDGDKDLVALTCTEPPGGPETGELLWYENPEWTPHHIDDVALHDIEVVDLDGDGRPDIVGRNQGAFGNPKGNALYFYRQESPLKWNRRTVAIPDGEGLAVADINNDGRPDVIIGQYWLENPGDILNGTWKLHQYSKTWTYPHVFVATGDLNGDGRLDIALSPSEKAGGMYRISWFEAPRDPTKEWQEHVIEDNVETVHHFIGTADFDKDGQRDIAIAAMQQGKSPEVSLYINAGRGKKWTKYVVAPTSSHSMRIVDVDGDGLPSLYGANWRGGHMVELWKNTTRK